MLPWVFQHDYSVFFFLPLDGLKLLNNKTNDLIWRTRENTVQWGLYLFVCALFTGYFREVIEGKRICVSIVWFKFLWIYLYAGSAQIKK